MNHSAPESTSSTSTINAVFAYGTLKRGHCRSHHWPGMPIDVREARIQASLFDVGFYPAIGQGEDWVAGEFWEFSPDQMPHVLESLDIVEGFQQPGEADLYVRRKVECYFDDGSVKVAYTYFFADASALLSLRRIASKLSPGGLQIARWPDEIAKEG